MKSDPVSYIASTLEIKDPLCMDSKTRPNNTLPLKVENIHIIFSPKGKEKETYSAISCRNSSLSIN